MQDVNLSFLCKILTSKSTVNYFKAKLVVFNWPFLNFELAPLPKHVEKEFREQNKGKEKKEEKGTEAI